MFFKLETQGLAKWTIQPQKKDIKYNHAHITGSWTRKALLPMLTLTVQLLMWRALVSLCWSTCNSACLQMHHLQRHTPSSGQSSRNSSTVHAMGKEEAVLHKPLPRWQLPCVSIWDGRETWETSPETASTRQESQSWCCHSNIRIVSELVLIDIRCPTRYRTAIGIVRGLCKINSGVQE